MFVFNYLATPTLIFGTIRHTLSVFTRRGAMGQEVAQSKFLWTLLILQIVFVVFFFLLVRYHPSADASHVENQKGHDHDLEENLEKYPSEYKERLLPEREPY
jgi:hypothetical protein